MKLNFKIFGLVFIFWFFVGCAFLISYVLDASNYRPDFEFNAKIIYATLTIYMVWFLLTCLLYSILKNPVEKGQVLVSFLIVFTVLLISLPSVTYLDQNALPFFEGKETSSFLETLSKTPYSYMFFNFVFFLMVTIVCTGIIYQQHSKKIQQSASELKKEQFEIKLKLASLRMQTLQNQLSPHFLFNSLSAISAIAKFKRPEEVTDAIAQLGDLLRYALTSSKKSLVSLDKEQSFISNYIYFQELRFNDRITFNVKLLASHNKLVCPPFITQTLIENAISHGMNSAHSMLINVVVKVSDHNLLFIVNNTKSTLKKTRKKKGIGIGIENLKQRLRMIYGDNYSMDSIDHEKEYTVTVIIPIKGGFNDY